MAPDAPECETCHDQGGNWDCHGQGDEGCPCGGCTGNDTCPACGAMQGWEER